MLTLFWQASNMKMKWKTTTTQPPIARVYAGNERLASENIQSKVLSSAFVLFKVKHLKSLSISSPNQKCSQLFHMGCTFALCIIKYAKLAS